jgi:acyl carrier protein
MDVPRDQPFLEAGLDSIAAVELRNAVSAHFGVELPVTVTFDYPSINALALYISQHKAAPGQEFADKPAALAHVV